MSGRDRKEKGSAKKKFRKALIKKSAIFILKSTHYIKNLADLSLKMEPIKLLEPHFTHNTPLFSWNITDLTSTFT